MSVADLTHLQPAAPGGNPGGNAGGCTIQPIPSPRYPVYSTTVRAVVPIGETTATVSFVAERDTLVTGLSTGELDEAVTFNAEYCRTVVARNALVGAFGACCSRKPIFLIGVRENKRLTFEVNFLSPVIAETIVEFTLSGFQGGGCCGGVS